VRWGIANFLPGLVWNNNSPDFSILSS
jgi:hypothetical protein